MNEIEAKRKELSKLYNEDALKFYDLGVKDAQKEFLDLIERIANEMDAESMWTKLERIKCHKVLEILEEELKKAVKIA